MRNRRIKKIKITKKSLDSTPNPPLENEDNKNSFVPKTKYEILKTKIYNNFMYIIIIFIIYFIVSAPPFVMDIKELLAFLKPMVIGDITANYKIINPKNFVHSEYSAKTPHPNEYPELSIHVENNLVKPINLREAEFTVFDSQIIPEPLFEIRDQISSNCSKMGFLLTNRGWGAASEIQISGYLFRKSGRRIKAHTSVGNLSIGKSKFVNLKKYFLKLGFNSSLIKKYKDCKTKLVKHEDAEENNLENFDFGKFEVEKYIELSPRQKELIFCRDKIIKLLKPFYHGKYNYYFIPIKGKLTYKYKILDEDYSHGSATFDAQICLWQPLSEGIGGDEKTAYHVLQFKTNTKAKKPYTVSIPINYNIKGYEGRRFEVTLFSKVSSRHKFTVKLKYSNGKHVVSPPIYVDIHSLKSEHQDFYSEFERIRKLRPIYENVK